MTYPAFSRRYYAGGGTYTTLAADMGSGDTTFSVASASGWPGTPGVDFLVVIGRGTALEEVILCTQNVSTTVTVDSANSGRGFQGSAVAHSAGATVYLCWGQIDADEANQITNLLGNGTSGDLLVAAGAATIPAWSTADSAGIVDKTTTQTLSSKTLASPVVTGVETRAGVNSAGGATASTPTFSNGTAAQLAQTTKDAMVYLTVGTAGTAMVIAIGPTSTPANTVVSSSVATGGEVYAIRLPAGWYLKWTATTATIANQLAITC